VQDSTSVPDPMKFSESLSNKDIKQKATIYKKETLRFLSEYQKLINSSTQEICLKNPSFLASRQKLLDIARSKVDSIYSPKKGKSPRAIDTMQLHSLPQNIQD